MADAPVQPTAQPATEQQDVDWKQRHDMLAAQYQKDMEQVYNVLTQQQQTAQQQQVPQQQPAQPDWDVTDPKQLKANVEQSLNETMTRTMTPVVLAMAEQHFETHMTNARRDERMPYFGYWENEIRQLARNVQPGLLAQYGTIVNLYQIVASQHQPEIVELQVRQRLAAEAAKQHSDEVEIEDDSSPEQAPTSPAQTPPAPPRLPQARPAPVAQPQVQQTQRSQRSSSRRLTREEAYMASQMGMSLKEYADAKDLGDYDI